MINRIRSLFANIFPRVGVPTAAEQFFLWDGIAPGSENQHGSEKINFMGRFRLVSNVHRPSITAFIPTKEKATGVAIIIAPGGGHKDIWIEHEGYAPAQWFCEHGIASFVLKYRLSKDVNSPYSVTEHALKDIQRAIRFVRSKSDLWGVEKNKIGVMGFSAGGELAGLAAIHFDEGKENASDDIDKQSCYPDFQALIYPSDTRNFSVSKKSSPLFVLAGSLDSEIVNDISNLHSKYQQSGSPAVLHIYENVNHGFGVQKSHKGKLAEWPMQFYEWLSVIGLRK